MIARRRLLLAACLAAPFASLAQQPAKLRRVGVLSLSVAGSEQAQYGRLIFESWLRKAGYEEGKNIAVEWRYAEGDAKRLAALADELVRLKVEVLIASFNDAIAAAQRATRTIPIVMLNSLSPVEQGFVASLARPGANITGTAWSSPETGAKILSVLKEAAPRVKRVALIGNPGMQGAHDFGVAAGKAAASLGIEAQFFGATKPEEVAQALARVAAARPQGLYVALDTALAGEMRVIADFALKRKLPAIGNLAQFAEAGGLLSYGPDFMEIGLHTMEYVARILGGARPADLPVVLPSTYELVINARTAKAIGLKMPQSLLLQASRVIE
jgi:putative ABC transport system substrate-binding protein